MPNQQTGLHNPSMEVTALGCYLEGPAPLGAIQLEFQQGMTVLYGHNGSGKTRMLQAVRDVLEGCRTSGEGRAALHVNVAPDKQVEATVDGAEPSGGEAWLGRAMLPEYTDGPVSELVREDWNGLFGPTNSGGLLLCTGWTPRGRTTHGWNVIEFLDTFQPAGVHLDLEGVRDTRGTDRLPFHVEAAMNNGWDHPIGFVSQDDSMIDVYGLDDDVDLDAATVGLLAHPGEKGRPREPRRDLERMIDRLHETVRMIQAALSSPARELEFNLRQPRDWFFGAQPRWEARTPLGNVPLDALSFAEERWTRFCLRLALRSVEAGTQQLERPLLLLLDEPERGLHRAAEFALAESIGDLAEFTAGDTMILAASHSPAFLAEPRATHYLVERTVEGRAAITTERPDTAGGGESELSRQRFGLRSTDFSELVRVWVCVEGPHDLAVLKAFLPNVLKEASARVMVLGGAKALPSAASPIFLELTDAPIAVLLDKVGSTVVEDLWHAALGADDDDEARRLLAKLKKAGGYEAQGLANLGFAALDAGVPLDRFVLLGLEEEDIIKYLPVEDFVRDGESWEEVLRGRKAGQSLKPFLRTLRDGEEISNADVWTSALAAAQRVEIPGELLELGERLQQLATGVGEVGR